MRSPTPIPSRVPRRGGRRPARPLPTPDVSPASISAVCSRTSAGGALRQRDRDRSPTWRRRDRARPRGARRFTVGAVGPVGERIFLIHAAGAERLTVKVEKQQVAVLASYLARIVRGSAGPAACPRT